ALTQYQHYPDGAVSRIVYPNTLSVRRDYNSRGQLSATGSSDSNNNWLLTFATYHYRQDGKLDYQDYANGVHTGFAYDARGVLSQETVSHGGQIYSQRTLYRDDRDRITAFQKSSNPAANPMENGRGDRFRYDEEGQLLEAWYNAADPVNSGTGNTRYDGFNYEALGNRHGMNYVQTHGWQEFSRKDNGLNQYRMWSPFSVTNYDDDIGGSWGTPGHANGVLMQDGNITAGYNALNQPVLATSNTLNPNWIFFGYDPLGRCVKRWVAPPPSDGSLVPPADSNPATYFYYEGWNLIQEGTSYANASRNYIHGARVDEIVKQITPSNWWERYFQYDARGHCTLQTDAYGNINEQYEYDAFGQPYFYDGSGTNIGYSPFGNRFLFTGREYLSELKLYDYRNRLYQPELGRFMQPDPKEFGAGDYNLYRYCHNDPVNKTDPFGDDWLEFNGSTVTWYPGDLGDRRNPLFTVGGTSGKVGYQDSSSTNVVGKGPVPEGDYSINTALDPARTAEIIPQGEAHEGEYYSANGIQQTTGEDWGTERARLEKAPDNPTDRDNFYLHNSDKGQTSGCIEAPDKQLWDQLHKFHDDGKKRLPVRVEYEKPKK
ncbi:MAG: RHS repeat-associated core domain-containing protein, partial [Chthoniobacterales bacterium]